jgi:hypothetical protein
MKINVHVSLTWTSGLKTFLAQFVHQQLPIMDTWSIQLGPRTSSCEAVTHASKSGNERRLPKEQATDWLYHQIFPVILYAAARHAAVHKSSHLFEPTTLIGYACAQRR